MKIAFIGAGNMGGAIATGIVRAGVAMPHNVTMCDTDAEKINRFASLGMSVLNNISDISEDVEIIVLAVKPQGIDDILPQLRKYKNSIFVSIAAGITIAHIKSVLGLVDYKVMRTMPNMPALIGRGMTAIVYEPPVSESDAVFVKQIFSAVGAVEEIEESLMDVTVALNGSSPAYAYMLIDAMASYGAKKGLAPEVALRLAAQSVMGAAEMALKADASPAVLTERVCSPGGTTIEAVKVLQSRGFGEIIDEAMEQCSRRSAEISAKTQNS